MYKSVNRLSLSSMVQIIRTSEYPHKLVPCYYLPSKTNCFNIILTFDVQSSDKDNIFRCEIWNIKTTPETTEFMKLGCALFQFLSVEITSLTMGRNVTALWLYYVLVHVPSLQQAQIGDHMVLIVYLSNEMVDMKKMEQVTDYRLVEVSSLALVLTCLLTLFTSCLLYTSRCV